MMRHSKPVLVALVLVMMVSGATPAAADVSSEKETLQRIRQLTGRYHSLKQAERDDFKADPHCVSQPGVGGMGYHHINFSRVDGTLDPDRPEIMLYASKKNGQRRLIGVEYMVVDADQNLGTDDDRPSLNGQPFDGPMPGHGPGMPVHYDLHVWAWADNPDGAFATWNPTITCP